MTVKIVMTPPMETLKPLLRLSSALHVSHTLDVQKVNLHWTIPCMVKLKMLWRKNMHVADDRVECFLLFDEIRVKTETSLNARAAMFESIDRHTELAVLL